MCYITYVLKITNEIKTKADKMTKVKMNINGEIINARMFKTLQAAQRFISKNASSKIVFYRAHEYYVSI